LQDLGAEGKMKKPRLCDSNTTTSLKLAAGLALRRNCGRVRQGSWRSTPVVASVAGHQME
jgi:hypothetical protein